MEFLCSKGSPFATLKCDGQDVLSIPSRPKVADFKKT